MGKLVAGMVDRALMCSTALYALKNALSALPFIGDQEHGSTPQFPLCQRLFSKARQACWTSARTKVVSS